MNPFTNTAIALFPQRKETSFSVVREIDTVPLSFMNIMSTSNEIFFTSVKFKHAVAAGRNRVSGIIQGAYIGTQFPAF